jgi:hypothetical protein
MTSDLLCLAYSYARSLEKRDGEVEENILSLLFVDSILTYAHFSYFQYESDQFIPDILTQLKDKQLTLMTFNLAMQ